MTARSRTNCANVCSHVACSFPAAAGVPIRTLQEWLGHADIKTTQIYAHYAPSAHEVAFVNSVFTGGSSAPGSCGPAATRSAAVWSDDDVLVGTSVSQLRRRRGVYVAGRALAAHGARITFEDGRDVAVEAVVWDTGFRSGYEWIDVPVIDSNRAPSPSRRRHRLTRAVLPRPALIGWVHHDARCLVARITSPAVIGSVAVPALPASNEKQNPASRTTRMPSTSRPPMTRDLSTRQREAGREAATGKAHAYEASVGGQGAH